MIGPLSRSGPVLRAFTRSAALRRSVGLVGVVVALLAFTFTASMAFVRSADQRIAWDLGEAEASTQSWRVVPIGHGPTTTENRALTVRRATGWIGLQGMFNDSSGRMVSYQEGPWADHPFPQRDTLVEGRWPTRPGEVAVTAALGVSPGGRFELDNKVVGFAVVGVVRSAAAHDGRVLYAAPRTWASFDPVIIKRYPSMTTAPVAYWHGGGDPHDTAARIVADGVDAGEGIDLVTRDALVAGHEQTLLTKELLLYVGPSTTLLVGAGALVALLAGRWVRAHAPAFTAVGAPRSAIAFATVLADGVAALASGTIGAAVGIGAGLLVRPGVPGLTGRDLPPVHVPWGEATRLVLVPVLAALLVGARTTRLEAMGSPDVGRRQQGSGRFSAALRRAGAVALTCVAILLVGPSSASSDAQSALVLTVAVAWALLVPDVVTLGAGPLARTGPSADLAARKIRQPGGMIPAVALGVCAAAVVALALATSIYSEKAYSASHLVGDLPNDRVLLEPVSENAVPPSVRADFEAASGLRDPVLLKSVGRRREDGGGALRAVQSVREAERLLGHPLDRKARRTLESGGVLTQDDQPTTFTLDPDGRTWKPPTASAAMDPGWSNLLGGLTLEKNLPRGTTVSITRLAYLAPRREDVERADAAPAKGRFDPGYVTTPRLPPPVELPVWLTAASWLFALAVVAVSWAVARRIAGDLSRIAAGLRAAGVPASYTRRVAVAYVGYPLLVAIGWAVIGAVVAVGVPAVLVDGAQLTVTVPWPLVLSVVGAGLLSTLASAGLAARPEPS